MIDPTLPLSEQYRLAAAHAVQLDAAASLLEESKSAVLAERINSLIVTEGDIAHVKLERQVKGSDWWHEYLERMVEARRQAGLARVEVRYIEMRFQEWQSGAADARAERRL